MTGPVEPIRPIRLTGRQRKREAAEREPAPMVNVTVNLGQPEPGRPSRLAPEPPATPETHLIAQEARVRGLRGGQKVLDTARSAYLEAQWSGPKDRRMKSGRITKTTA